MSVYLWISTVSASNLAVSLLNSLWQGILIALLLSIVLRSIPAKWANLRYRISLCALFAVPFLCMTTWSLLNSPPNHPALYFIGDSLSFYQSVKPVESTTTINDALSVNHTMASNSHWPWTSWILITWFCGVSFMLFRFVKNVLMVNRLCLQCRSLEDRRVLDVVENFAKSLNITRPIQVWINDSLQSPAAIGILQPAILLPASVISGLPMETLRAMTAHGVVLDASTGLPMKGMLLSAVPEDRSSRNFRTESPTNEKGEFRFSTLPEGRYTLRPDQGETDNLHPLQFDAGHMQPIILKVNIPLEDPFLIQMKSRMQETNQRDK